MCHPTSVDFPSKYQSVIGDLFILAYQKIIIFVWSIT
jgi:hypothetical protein